MITISQALGRAADLPASCDNPQLDVSLLLCAVLNKPASFLRTWPERKLTAEQQQGFEALLARRIAGEPIAYILREQAFWTLTLEVSESTLIPEQTPKCWSKLRSHCRCPNTPVWLIWVPAPVLSP